MSNVHKREINDSRGDLVEVEYYHHGCAYNAVQSGYAPPEILLDSPCPDAQDSPVYCHECKRRIAEIPLTLGGVATLPDHLNAFQRGYVECALFSSVHYDESGNNGASLQSMGYDVQDIDHESLLKMMDDCTDFLYSTVKLGSPPRNPTGVHSAYEVSVATLLEPYNMEQAGSDFWLTRNRHGAGYWDGSYPHNIGNKLTEAAHVYGSSNLDIAFDNPGAVTLD